MVGVIGRAGGGFAESGNAQRACCYVLKNCQNASRAAYAFDDIVGLVSAARDIEGEVLLKVELLTIQRYRAVGVSDKGDLITPCVT